MKHTTVYLFGLNFFNGSLGDAVELIASWEHANPDRVPLVLTPNTDILVKMEQLRKNAPVFVQRLAQSSFILADGFPVVLASRLRKRPLPGVVPGSDVLPVLIRRTASRRFLFVGPDERTLGIIGQRMASETDHLVRWIAPPIMEPGTTRFNQQADQAARTIREFQPHFVVVGLGFPKQEYFSLAVLDRLDGDACIPLFMGLGASAEFLAGTKKRAPGWMRSLRLEWLHRLLSEPRRMYRRYICGAIRIVPLLYREWRRGN